MADEIRIGTRIINDQGTCLKVVRHVASIFGEDERIEPGTVPSNRVHEFIEAGYRAVTESDVIPVQAHQVGSG